MKIQHGEVQQIFNTRLAEAGIDLKSPDAIKTWQVFKNFAAVAIECRNESFLFDAIGKSATRTFAVQFARYLRIEEPEDSTAWTFTIDCGFEFELHEEFGEFTKNFGGDVDGTDEESRTFLNRIDSYQEFWEVIARHKPKEAFIYIGGV